MGDESSEQTQGTPDSAGTVSISTGFRLPYFTRKRGGRPSIFSIRDMNMMVKCLNALMNMRIERGLAPQDPNDESSDPSGQLHLADSNSILELLDAPPGSPPSDSENSISLWQVQSYTAGNEYVTCLGATATADDTYTTAGSSTKIALPYELRTNPFNSPGIDPPYIAGDIILAVEDPDGGTGVFVSGVDVGIMDLNGAARRWIQEDYFTLVTMFANYFTAQSVVSGLTVAIAKPPELRNSITGETIDGNSWAYTYLTTGTYAYVTRKADATISGTDVTEYQVIVPRYLNSTGLIKARQMTTGLTDGSSNPILWQEVSGREWAARASQAGYENT